LAAVIIIFAAQMLFGSRHLWLPSFLSERKISAKTLINVTKKVRLFGNWLDRWFHERLPTLTSAAGVRVAAAACIILALAVPPLELFPFVTCAGADVSGVVETDISTRP
jgi:hypothetical protein